MISTLGIHFNNKHSYYDLGLSRINSKENEIPEKNKIKERVPFQHGSYDFSELYGLSYSERTLNFSFFIENDNEEKLKYLKVEIDNWLMGSNNKTKLIDDDLEGYYYLAECESINYDNYYNFGIIDVVFNAYPYKIAKNTENADIFDEFNFELDYSQKLEFNIKGLKEIEIFNRSIVNSVLEITASSTFILIKNGINFTISKGLNKDYRLELIPGLNSLAIQGNGIIQFNFRVELL